MAENRICPVGSFGHTIVSGDTLYNLARTYNTTVEAILAINPGINPNNLQIGSTVCIPSGSTPTQCPVGSFAYIIHTGDTLYNLAIEFNTTVNAILALNPGLNPNNLIVGTVICIPGTGPTPQCPVGSFKYIIHTGDTLYNLAIEFNTTVDAILALNPGLNPNNLIVGTVICMPGTAPIPQCPVGSFSYIIHTGDTLYNLAIEFNTTVNAILALNPGLNPNNLIVGTVICIPGTGPTPQCPVGSFSYTIKQGDTLYNLARTYNTTVEAILAINPGLNPNNLIVGSIICIPSGSTPTQCPIGSFAYTIKQGDTLYNLAITYNTTVNAILALNPGLNPNNLIVGSVICIPLTSPTPQCPAGSFAYTIKPGDTLFNIARAYNTTVDAILALNPGLNPNNLQIGQVICIPDGEPFRCPVGSFSYTIKQGDTLYNLARTYNTTVDAILRLNPWLDPTNMPVGTVICIPNADPVGCPGGTTYVVKDTDNLAVILLKFDISIMDLMYANPDVDWKMLIPGDVLCILPHKDMGCACSKTERKYTITQADVPQSGSTVVALAKKFNVSVSSLMKMNPNLTASDFVVGQMICVPKL